MINKIYKILKKLIQIHFMCNHNFKFIPAKPVPNAYDLMVCDKCGWCTSYDYLLIDKNN